MGIVGEMMAKVREAAKKQEEEAAQAQFSNADMMAGLEGMIDESPEAAQSQVAKGEDEPDNTEESDAAPVGSNADALTAEEEAQLQAAELKKQFLNAVQAVSSASETDEAASGSEAAGRKAQKAARMKQPQTKSALASVKEASSSSTKRPKKVQYYKG